MSIRTDQHARNVVEKLESALKSARTVLTDICPDEAAAVSASTAPTEGAHGRPGDSAAPDTSPGPERDWYDALAPVWDALWHIATEAELRAGFKNPRYDMTLDYLFEHAWGGLETLKELIGTPGLIRTGYVADDTEVDDGANGDRGGVASGNPGKTQVESPAPSSKPSDPRYDRPCPGCGKRIGSHGPVDSARCLAKLGLEDSVTRKGGYQGSAGPVPKRVDGPAAGFNPPVSDTGQGTDALVPDMQEVADRIAYANRVQAGPTWDSTVRAAFDALDAARSELGRVVGSRIARLEQPADGPSAGEWKAAALTLWRFIEQDVRGFDHYLSTNEEMLAVRRLMEFGDYPCECVCHEQDETLSNRVDHDRGCGACRGVHSNTSDAP